MAQKIHGRATTTPAIRKAIQESTKSTLALSRLYNVSPRTVQKWRNRTTTQDLRPGPEARSKSLTRAQEAAVVAFRKKTQLSLEDCLYSFRKEIPTLTQSSLYRCFKRHNINRLPQATPQKKEKKKFTSYNPGYVHVDITQLYTEEGKLYLFVGIDRTTKFCFLRLYKDQTAATSTSFLRELHDAFPNKITHILTDNGLQFTHYKGEKSQHIFTKTCHELGIEHRTTKPYHPWTNGQVERMNRTIKEATIKKFYYQHHEKLQEHLEAFIETYNYAQPLKALEGMTPYEKVCVYLQSKQGKSYLNPRYKIPKDYT